MPTLRTVVNRFLAIRETTHDIVSVRNYVSIFEASDNKLLLGVFDSQTGSHIGNVTFSSIDRKNEVGVIGIAIGDKAFRGKGYGTEALALAVEYAFKVLVLHRIDAWVSVNNISSQKLFTRVGFEQEGLLKDRVKFEGGFVDAYIYGLINGPKWK